MPTANRWRFVPAAIGMFLAQDYAEKELIILDDGEDAVEDLIPSRPELRYIRVGRRRPLGAKRNEACAEARGEIILHWDDDDWYAPTRVRYQVENLVAAGADLCGIDRVFFMDPPAGQAWEYVYPAGAAPWVHGATLCYRRDFWRAHPFAEINIGEDTRFVMGAREANLRVLPDNRFFVGLVHDANTSPKRVRDARWQPRSFQMIESIMRGETSPGLPQAAATGGSRAPGAGRPSASGKSALPEVCVGVHVDSEPERLAATVVQLKANSPSGIDILLLADGPDTATRAALACLTQYRQSATFEPRGAAASFNRLLRESDAEVLIFLESGCLVGPGWLDLILASLAADPRNGLAGPTTNSAWSLQGAFRDRRASADNVSELAAKALTEFGHAWRTLEPLYCLADFCYAIRRPVAEAIGAADEEYGLGPCWEMDYTARAIRSGFQAVWAQGAYVFRHPFSARRRHDEARFFEANKRRYQDNVCGLKLSGMRDGYARHCRGDVCPHFAPVDRIRRAIPLAAPTIPARPVALAAEHAPPSNRVDEARPLASCIMPTRDRLDWLLQSIRYFDRQDYPARELIIIDDGVRDLSSLLPRDPRIRYLKLCERLSIGEKRNRACEAARGPIIVHWDDDDWYGPKRLSAQLTPLLEGTAEITGLQDTIFFDLDEWQFWKCSTEIYARLFVRAVHGGTLAFRREVFEAKARYPNRSLAEDAMFLLAALRCGACLQTVDRDGLFAYVRHRGNSWRFVCGKEVDAKGWWQCEEPPFLRGDRDFYLNMSKAKPAHLVSRSYDLRIASLQPGGP
jgi:glycosyltransferase involved in cell wall biosynthesis